MKYQRKPEIVEAVQFDPDAKEWPPIVKPWSKFIPRDMSLGFVDTPLGRIHVHAGDYIVTVSTGDTILVKEKIFNQLYEPTKA